MLFSSIFYFRHTKVVHIKILLYIYKPTTVLSVIQQQRLSTDCPYVIPLLLKRTSGLCLRAVHTTGHKPQVTKLLYFVLPGSHPVSLASGSFPGENSSAFSKRSPAQSLLRQVTSAVSYKQVVPFHSLNCFRLT